MKKNTRHNLYWSPVEAGLLLLSAAVAWAVHQPLIFASLGPTAYELIEKPQLPSSKVYNVVVGHLVGLGSGFFTLYILGAWNTPKLLSSGQLSASRMWAVALAAIFTTIINLLLKSGQPAALSTTLLVALGQMQSERDGLAIIGGVFLIAIVGEPIRRVRLAVMQRESSSE
jgi:hypothetical protein